MGIDTTTFVAQIVNLFLLVWVLKHFLYTPVLTLLDKRRQSIVDKIQQARDQERQAHALLASYQEKVNQFEEQKATLTVQYQQELQDFNRLEKAKMQADIAHQRALLQEKLQQEYAQIQGVLGPMLGQQVVHLSQKVLNDLLGTQTGPLLIQAFYQQARQMTATQTAAIQSLPPKTPITIYTSHPLPDKEVKACKAFIKQFFHRASCAPIAVQQKPSLLLGICVVIGPFVVGKTLDNYTYDFQQEFQHFIQNRIKE